MKINNVETIAPAYLLVLNSSAPPPAPVAPGTNPFLTGVAGPTLTLTINKYPESNVVNFPSLEDYCRKTFPITDVPTDFIGATPHTIAKATQIAITRASNDIASKTRRGAGNCLFLGENSAFIPTLAGLKHKCETLDWLGPKECLVLYTGNRGLTGTVVDNGFVWKANEDGTVDVNAQPRVADYGQFLRFI